MSRVLTHLRELGELTPKLGEGAYGPLWDSPRAVKCYAEPGFRRVTDQHGNEVVAELFCVFGPSTDINVGDKFEYDGRAYRTINVQKLRRFGSLHHIEAYFAGTKE